MAEIGSIMRIAPVIPVLVIEDVAYARPIAEALVAGGLHVLEVTMRTPAALPAIREMRRVPGAVVGAGTVLDAAMFDAAREAGAEFIVSPGLTERIGVHAQQRGLPFLPGVANAGDIMRGLELGFTHFKFFPAASSGGVPALKALLGPFAQCRFCPTGGITVETAPEWLAMSQVLCVGGSWLVPKGAPNPTTITLAARAASALACAQ
jgi:2-dehydro-3-deoxyphosphogluconate aldolase/(4S)-4-hydroxy-2-oxoglutarate aldolase